MAVTIPVQQQALAERHADDLAEFVEALDASSTDDCVDCGKALSGLLGTFRWGIVHGCGECAGCGYPYAYYHYHRVTAFEDGELLLCAWVPGTPIPLATEAP